MRVRKLWRGPDWLELFWFVLVAGLVTAGGSGVARIVNAASGGPIGIHVPLREAGRGNGPGHFAPGTVVDPSGWVAARVDDPTPLQSLLDALTTLPTTVVVVAMLITLLRIVGNARRADPFTARTVRLLRILGGTVLLGGALADVVRELAGRALTGPLVDAPVGGFAWSGWWLVGLAFLAIGEVVKRGVAMRTELETVI